MAWLEKKKHPSLYPDVENVISHYLEVGHNISMWLCGYVCWLTTKLLSESTYYLPTILTKFTSQAAPMSCKCRGNMRSIISTGHFSNAWPPACKWSIQQFTGMDFFYTWHYWSQRGFVLFWRSFGSLRKVQVENLVHYWLTHSDPWPRW